MGCTSSNAIQEEENSKNINPKSINQNKDIVPNKTQTESTSILYKIIIPKKKPFPNKKNSKIMKKGNCLKNKKK